MGQYTEKAIIQNRNSFLTYYFWIKLLCLSMFKYNNLPQGCDSDYIEKQFFENGNVVFANHKNYGIINLQLAGETDFNFYDKPIKFDGKAGSFTMKCNPKNSVVVQNNILSIPTMSFACYFAYKISRIDRVFDVNLLGIKTPLIFQCSQQERLTLEKILTDIECNVPIIKTKSNFNINDKINVLETKQDFLLDKLRDEKISAFSECLTFLGIKNVNITKKERLITDEANSNNELTEMDLQIFLDSRKKGIEEINNKFGTNITVEPVQHIIEKFNLALEKLEEGEKDVSSESHNQTD